MMAHSSLPEWQHTVVSWKPHSVAMSVATLSTSVYTKPFCNNICISKFSALDLHLHVGLYTQTLHMPINYARVGPCTHLSYNSICNSYITSTRETRSMLHLVQVQYI